MTDSVGRLGQTDIYVDLRRLRTQMLLTGDVGGHDVLTLGTTVQDIFDLGGTGQQLDADSALAQGDLIVADSTPNLTLLNHPGAAGYAFTTDGTDVLWDQTPTWTGLHTFDGGLLIGSGQTADLNGEVDALVLDLDGDTSLSAPTDDQIDVEIGGIDCFTFTASEFNVLSGSRIVMADDAWIGFGALAGRLVFDSTPNPDQVELTDADLYIATGSHGIIHADGNTAGMVLRADGTRYVPAAANANLPVAPSARGHILRAEAGPVWASYDASTLGAVLIGDGTDIVADTTPTLVGALTMDDGAGDSPALQFVGGSNDDTVLIYLDDDATSTDSDLVIRLCDTAGDSVLAVHDSTPAAVLEIDSNGNLELQNDNTWIGRGAASARIEFVAAGSAVALYDGTDLTLYSDSGVTQKGLWDGATGNITLVDDAWVGLGAASTRITFDSTGNSVDLYSAADLRLFSDAGVTQVGLWDGATGNIQLDDGSGDSPEIQFIGGTNDDTIKIFLDDDAATSGGSDLNVQLADAAGASGFEIWSSTPAAVLKIDSDGNVELVNDDAWIGMGAAAGRIIFDSTPTPDVLRIKNANLVMTNDSGTDILTIRRSGDVTNTEADIYANARLGLAADNGIHLFIDAANDGVADNFIIYHDGETTAGATELMRLNESGNLLPGSAKSQDLGSATLEWDNIYYVTANTGTSRLIESSRVCPVCNNQMNKGTGSLNIRGEDADYELVFCLSCGNAAVEVRDQQTTEMLAQRKPPPQIVLSDVRVSILGGRDYKVMLDFDYGGGITNSTRLGDRELAELETMSVEGRKDFVRALGEREWYAREESRILQDHVLTMQSVYKPMMDSILGLNLIQ